MLFEEQIIKYLSKGLSQQEISAQLKIKGTYPSSLSSIEKIYATLRKKYKAKTNFHLAVILCRKGVIK
ncbi:MAG TPA: hypothetical protein PKE30_11090 [Niabella sp.]|nr:hypothetical protein [Niabella sp.]